MIYLALVGLCLVAVRSRLYDALWLNMGNSLVLRRSDGAFIVRELQNWSATDWVQSQVLENARVASIMTQEHQATNQQDLMAEFHTALVPNRKNNLSFAGICAEITQSPNELGAYLLPVSLSLAQHPEFADWNLKGISLDEALSQILGTNTLVLWWQKQTRRASKVPLAQDALTAPCYAGDIVGVPVRSRILNQDPQFTRSAQLQLSRFAQGARSPFLIGFSPLRTQSDTNFCLSQYAFYTDANVPVALQLPPGCILVSPSFSLSQDDLLLLAVRFKTTRQGKGAVALWWWNINASSDAGGYSPDTWSTHLLLFDMPRCCAGSSQILLEAQEQGILMLDYIFLLHVGG